MRIGSPGETIAGEAAARQADLIVMGTKGQGAAGALLGSVAQSTVGASSVPVLLVR